MDIRSLGNTIPTAPSYTDKGLPGATAQAVSVKPAAGPAQPDAAVQQPDPAPSLAQVSEAIKGINKAIQALSQNVEFTIDEDTDRAIVMVVDQQTKEVIRQMPSKEALEIAKALDRVQGLILRQQA